MHEILGVLSMAVIAAWMKQDIEEVSNTDFGQPIVQVGQYIKKGRAVFLTDILLLDICNDTLGFMAVVMTVQFFMSLRM